MALSLTGINTNIIKTTLGASTNDTGQLCIHSNVNKWAKFKPVPLAENAPSRVSGSTWYRATNGNCGLNIPNYSTMALMFTALRNSTTMWDYQKPTGGANSPYRLADFGGYEHNAQPPLVPMSLYPEYYAVFNILGTSLSLRVQNQYELTVNDLGYTYNLGGMYYGVAICKQGTSGYKYMTQNVTISAGGGGALDVPISTELGTYEVVYFLATNKKLLISDPDIVNTFIPIPNAMQIVTIKSTPITVELSGSFGLNTANYSIKFTNGYGTGLNVNGCNIAFRYANKIPSDPLVMGEKTKSLGDVVVPANSSTTLSGTITGVGADYNSLGGYLYFTNLTNTAYNTRYDI